MSNLKQAKNAQRSLVENEEAAMYELIRELEQRKEKEVRAQIEKEEIVRAIKVTAISINS
jgi:hypothetical protein